MKKRKFKYILWSVLAFVGLFIILSIIAIYVFPIIPQAGNHWGVIATMMNGLIATIAAGLVLFQLEENEKALKRQNDIEAATFITQLNQMFLHDPDLTEIERLLEAKAFHGQSGSIFYESNRQKFVNYLAYFDGLAPLVLRNVLSLQYIDDLMAYRFFLAVNNPEVQNEELFVFPGDYRGCFKLYKIWKEYRINNKLKIHFSDTSLDKWPYFQEYANESFSQTITPRQLSSKSEGTPTESDSYKNNNIKLTDSQKKDIADLIYDTDLDIYKKMFSSSNTDYKSRENAQKIIPLLLDSGEPDAMFNLDNMFVCTHEQEIIGLILWKKGSLNWNPAGIKEAAKNINIKLVEENISSLSTDYFAKHYNEEKIGESPLIYILNVCVKAEYRRSGVGNILLSSFIKNHSSSRMELTVLANNRPAIALYKNNGFTYLSSYHSNLDNTVICNIMRR